LSGLRGPADVDGDGSVALNEAYGFAYSRTLLRTAGSRGTVQHPAFDLQLEGAGPITLTRTKKATSQIILPAEPSVTYFVYSLPSVVPVAEVPSRDTATTTVAVPQGRVLVPRRDAKGASLTELDLPWGGTRRLSASDFTPIDEQRLVVRGGRLALKNWSARVGYGLALRPGSASTGLTQTPEVGLAHDFSQLRLGALVFATRSPVALESLVGSEYRMGIRADLGYLVDRAWYTFWVSTGPLFEPIWQRLSRVEAERVRKAGFTAEQNFSAAAWGGAAQLGCSLGIGAHFSALAELSGALTWYKTATADGAEIGPHFSMRAGLGVSYAF
jgi:hypothetical protein